MYRGDEYLFDGTQQELADFLGVRRTTIQHYLTDSWIDRASENSIRVVLIDELSKVNRISISVDQYLEYKSNNVTDAEIARNLGVTKSSITKWKNRNGLKVKKYSKSKYD